MWKNRSIFASSINIVWKKIWNATFAFNKRYTDFKSLNIQFILSDKNINPEKILKFIFFLHNVFNLWKIFYLFCFFTPRMHYLFYLCFLSFLFLFFIYLSYEQFHLSFKKYYNSWKVYKQVLKKHFKRNWKKNLTPSGYIPISGFSNSIKIWWIFWSIFHIK